MQLAMQAAESCQQHVEPVSADTTHFCLCNLSVVCVSHCIHNMVKAVQCLGLQALRSPGITWLQEAKVHTACMKSTMESTPTANSTLIKFVHL